METPSSVLYADLKKFGGIKNSDAAELLLDLDAPSASGTVRSRLTDRTFLSREVVHVNPRRVQPDIIADIPRATLTLAGRLTRSRTGAAHTLEELAAHYGGDAARTMASALDANGVDGAVYRNALTRIAYAYLPNERNRGILFLMLFVGTGCLADPARAAGIVEEFARNQLAQGLYTTEMDVGTGFSNDVVEHEPERLGLLRMVGNNAREPLHRLSTDPAGTVIGALAAGPQDVADVDRDISRRHLRIWLEDGRWYAQGLGSTNGSALISGVDRATVPIEPPRGARTAGTEYPPVEIHAGDLLCLGATTRFLVYGIADHRRSDAETAR